jgi:hypothetical protein
MRSLGLGAVVIVAGCIIQRGQPGGGSIGAPNDYVGAAVFAATGLGGAAVNRKLTGDCYANCQAGYYCNHDSGICERKTCECPADQVCERIGGENVCVQPLHRREDEDAGRDAADAD